MGSSPRFGFGGPGLLARLRGGLDDPRDVTDRPGQALDHQRESFGVDGFDGVGGLVVVGVAEVGRVGEHDSGPCPAA